MVPYNHLTQQDDESTSQYLIRAKVLLKHINHKSKLSKISGKGWNNLALIQGHRDSHIRWRVTKEQESWATTEDVYRCINGITKTEVWIKAYHEPRYDLISKVLTEGIHKVSYKKGKRQYSYDKSHKCSNFRKQYNNSPCNRYQSCSHSHQTPIKMKCYYCDGKHSIDMCEKFKKDKVKYNLNRANSGRSTKKGY